MNSLTDLITLAGNKPKKKLVVVAAHDEPVLKAVQSAVNLDLISPVLIGDALQIKKICKEINFDISSSRLEDEKDLKAAARKGVDLIRNNEGHILMKGLIGSAEFLRSVVDNDHGLKSGNLLSHFALMETPAYHKLLGVTDVAMNIAPTFKDKIDILRNAVAIMHNLGYTLPKVAVLSPAETVNEKIESSVHGAMLTMMNKRKQLTGCIIDGPLALDLAISKESAGHKGIVSEVAGEADLLLASDLDGGNILYKSLIYFGKAVAAAIITGASVPVVLTSRSDPEQSKLMSIALAAALD